VGTWTDGVVEPVERDTLCPVRPLEGLRRFTLVRHEPPEVLRRFVDRRDFTAAVGTPPAAYARAAHADREEARRCARCR